MNTPHDSMPTGGDEIRSVPLSSGDVRRFDEHLRRDRMSRSRGVPKRQTVGVQNTLDFSITVSVRSDLVYRCCVRQKSQGERAMKKRRHDNKGEFRVKELDKRTRGESVGRIPEVVQAYLE